MFVAAHGNFPKINVCNAQTDWWCKVYHQSVLLFEKIDSQSFKQYIGLACFKFRFLQRPLYLAVVLDLFSRQVVGWSMQPHMQSSLVTDALRMAWFRRTPEAGVIFHSDRGSQYCGHEFLSALAGYRMKSSMSRKGDCWDNAPTESFWGRLKVGRFTVGGSTPAGRPWTR
jgi:transposase InsO family protein